MRRPRQDRERIRRRGNRATPGHSAFSHARSTCGSIPRSASNTCARAAILSTMCWGKLAAIDRPQMRLIGPRSVIASGRKVNNDRRPVVHAQHLERQIEQAPHALAGRLGVVD